MAGGLHDDKGDQLAVGPQTDARMVHDSSG